MKRELLPLLAMGILAGVPLWAQEKAAAGESKAGESNASESKKSRSSDQTIRRKEEVTVVSASRVESTLIDAPATMSVITERTLETTPANNVGDLLRTVPGTNVIQMSARDFNVTSRLATSTLSNSELVLVDGRSIYLDFYDLVLWDFVPTSSSNEIKQIEVVRGPASVVWGANAMAGVINIITKSPRENPGFGLTLSAGLFNRAGGSREADGDGYDYRGSFYYAAAPNDTWAYKLSAGYYNSDPYSRPVGIVGGCPLGQPCVPDPLDGSILTGGAPYPQETDTAGNFINVGTSQPKFDLRVDQRLAGGGAITYEGGYAGTTGIIHTGIGPFDIESPSYLAYGKVAYQRGALHVGAFGNFVNAKAPNLLQTDPETGAAVQLNFKTETYDLEAGNTSVLGGRHALTYGVSLRRNNFDITLAPDSENRNEFGAYVQDEFFLDKFRFAAGVRADKFGNLDKVVWSPRVSVMFKPTPDHSIRATYNRAFRSPSDINNYLDQNILQPPPPNPAIPPFINEPFSLELNTYGNLNLTEEHIDAFELAYTGTIHGKTTLGLSIYRNDINDNINFTYLYPPENPNLPPPTFYDVQNPARGFGAVTGTPFQLSPQQMAILGAFGVQLPWKVATYLNLGPLRNDGLEASISHRITDQVSVYGNYSYQKEPKPLTAKSGQIPYPIAEITVPPKSRFNAGVSVDTDRFIGSVTVNYAGKAFWNDVLNELYWGYSDAYTMLNATIGVRFAEGKVMVSLRGTNLANEKIQQHVFGDLLRRSVVAELRFFTK
jgi:outer membrane receptor protein involved in Fe transport